MSDTVNNGGPAFPVPDGEAANMGYHGLTKREYFAAQALAGMCQGLGWQGGNFYQMAHFAVDAADALLAALATGAEK